MHHREYCSTRVGRSFFQQGEVEFGDDVARGNETGIEPRGFECATEKQSGGEKQHERERDLRHDGYVSRREEAAKTSDARRLAYLFFKVLNQIGLRRFQCRAEAKEYRRDEAEQKRHRQNDKIRS